MDWCPIQGESIILICLAQRKLKISTGPMRLYGLGRDYVKMIEIHPDVFFFLIECFEAQFNGNLYKFAVNIINSTMTKFYYKILSMKTSLKLFIHIAVLHFKFF